MPSSSSPTTANLIPVRNLTPIGREAKELRDRNKPIKASEDLERAAPDYDIVLLKPEQYRGNFNCARCKKVFWQPVRYKDCDQYYCSVCFKLQLDTEHRYPKDVIRNKEREVAADKSFQQELDVVDVKCPYHANHCPWTGPYKNLQGHVALCAFKLSSCPKNCGAKFEKYFLQRHLRDECKYRDITCQFCKKKFSLKEKSAHAKICSKFTIICPKGCKMSVIKTEMEQHIENECPNQHVVCPYAEAGCKFQCLRRDVDEHIRSTLNEHIFMVTEAIQAALKFMKENKEKEEERLGVMTDRLTKVNTKINGLIKQYESHLIWKIDGFHEKFMEAKSAAGDGVTICIHSPYIAITRYGYRLKMTTYLYGYGAVEGMYMSLYVCLCSTDHDRLLKWPFHRVLELTLLDQCRDPQDRRDVTYCIDTSQEDETLIRRPPDSRNNPYFGTDRFIKIERLRHKDHYTLDDSIFIRINFLPPSS